MMKDRNTRLFTTYGIFGEILIIIGLYVIPTSVLLLTIVGFISLLCMILDRC